MKHRSVEGSTDGSPTASGWGNFSPMADGPEGSTATSTSEEGLENLMVEETEAASVTCDEEQQESCQLLESRADDGSGGGSGGVSSSSSGDW